MEDNSKYIDLFIEESQEHMLTLNQYLLELEKKGYNKDVIRQLYSSMHTIKGTAGVLGIDSISNIAHVMEDIFDIFQEREEAVEKKTIGLLFQCLDIIESMVKELSETGKITKDDEGIIKKLKLIYKENSIDKSIKNEIKKKEKKETLDLTDEQKQIVMEYLTENKNIYELDISIEEDLRFKAGRIFQLKKVLSKDGYVIASLPDFNEIDDSLNKIKLLFATDNDMDDIVEGSIDIKGLKNIEINPLSILQELKQVNSLEHKLDNYTNNDISDTSDQTKLKKSETIRIKSRLLDQLLDLVGEIMISNIRLNQISIDLKHRELIQVLKNTERLISELQDTVLRMRMVPVDHIFRRFPRMVRDKATEENKKVDLEIFGHDIEIDRSLLDGIGDALVHLLRNAVDHGIEPEDHRVTTGKKHNGLIKLSAYREQSNIVIEVEDDGRGLDNQKIMDKAIEKQIITKKESESLTEKEIHQLAFLPGISTASKVTDISGRGIGLDAVKSKIETLGGTIKLETKKGVGTKFTLKLPPSMSIISAMLVEINDEKYAIPLENVCETTKLPITEIHEVAKSGMFRLREEILPIYNIHTEFGGILTKLDKEMPVLVVEKDDNRAGLVVTRFIGQQEIVVKNLSKNLRSTPFFSGATILGDGNVALILDVSSLIN